jgi:hypothetical protein
MPIADCGDVTACLTCINDAAVQQAVGLYYDDQTPADPNGQEALNRCQQAIGRWSQRFLAATSKALALCWDARNRGKHGDTCPNPAAAPGTPARKAADAIARAASRSDDWICRICGGEDGLCDGTDDFTPAVIGSAPTCPAVAVPGGTSCTGTIATLQDLVACADCVTASKVSCLDRAAIPVFAPYPPGCE